MEQKGKDNEKEQGKGEGEKKKKRREEIMTVVQWVVGVSLAFVGFVAVVYFAAKWAGKI